MQYIYKVFFFPQIFVPIIGSVQLDMALGFSINLLAFISLLFLIYRVWSFREIRKYHKWTWTLLLIYLPIIASVFYIWKKDSEFIIENNLGTTE